MIVSWQLYDVKKENSFLLYSCIDFYFNTFWVLRLINPNGCFCNKTPDFTFFKSFLIAHNSTFCDAEKAEKKLLCIFHPPFFYFATMSLSRRFSAGVNDRIIWQLLFTMQLFDSKPQQQQERQKKKKNRIPRKDWNLKKYIYRSLKSKSQCMEAWYWHWVD